MNKIFTSLGILSDKKENNVLNNLTKVPTKDSNLTMPHTTEEEKYAVEQADLLFLPDDDGFKYLLVVVDVATRLTDAEPLKSKESKVVLKAMQKIFKRKILKIPKRLEVDAG
jgi:hypothetical protein